MALLALLGVLPMVVLKLNKLLGLLLLLAVLDQLRNLVPTWNTVWYLYSGAYFPKLRIG